MLGSRPGRSTLAAVACIVTAFVGFLPSTSTVFGQGITTGTISGTITDASGAAVPRAQITASSNGQGAKRETTSGANGQFAFYLVPIGQYTVNIVAPGFAGTTVNAVQVNASATSNLNAIQLALPNASTQV